MKRKTLKLFRAFRFFFKNYYKRGQHNKSFNNIIKLYNDVKY